MFANPVQYDLIHKIDARHSVPGKRSHEFDPELVNLAESDQSPFDQTSLQDPSNILDSDVDSTKSPYSIATDVDTTSID